MKLRVFEAFAGYGSQSIALGVLAQAFPDFQFEVAGYSEIDKHAIKAYKALHSDNITNYGDITKIDWTQTADFDFLTYSFPCQDISSAGKQIGLSEGCGSRSSLLWECARAIEVKHPQFLLMENVKALTQKKFSADFHKWREWLIKQGYTNYYTVLNAKDYGVPQNRERVFMVSFRGEHKPYTFSKPIKLVRRLKHVLEDNVDEKYWLKQDKVQALIKHNERKLQADSCGFKTNSQSGITNAITSDHNDSLVASSRVIQVGNLIENSNYKNPQRGRIYSIEGIAPCLGCCEGGNLEPKIIQRGHGYAKGGVFDIAPTLTTSSWQDNNFAVIEYRIRKLTPRECFRLMDVPEHYIDRLLATGIPNSQLYKLAGNSIVVSCLYHIFRKMFCETEMEIGAPIAHSFETPIIEQPSLF